MPYLLQSESKGAGQPAPFILLKQKLPFSLQQRLKRWENLLDNQAIALSRRMNAVGLVEQG